MQNGLEKSLPFGGNSGKSRLEDRALLPLAAPPPWFVHGMPGAGSDLVIAFASIGHDPSRPPSPEFVASASAKGRPALFIADASRSWCNAPGLTELLEEAVAAIRQRQEIRRILTVGQSMGGFTALVAASLIKVDAVLAIGPQFSVDPSLMAEERWSDWTRRIVRFTHPTAPLPPDTAITLLHGLADDYAQAMQFPAQNGVDHIFFPALSHSALAPHLKAKGCLQGLIEAALSTDRRRLLRLTANAGGIRRERWSA
ncbi:hypothetical protein Q9295_11085 [Xinfangfangia sp. CPCC 101601]|uniref:Alpha/beta hydrolase n=1 Tax=Pseudogemmobacter lacusdianii TaxID=3069608 RepID=A0ABU0VYT4_9RHOB|nr:hypothetical protein [Xinfangfangia sp. CPCC 101601]MDQ2066921.1 hypothetical protein [Xinfangfangia sp. CPCC 101601]